MEVREVRESAQQRDHPVQNGKDSQLCGMIPQIQQGWPKKFLGFTDSEKRRILKWKSVLSDPASHSAGQIGRML